MSFCMNFQLLPKCSAYARSTRQRCKQACVNGQEVCYYHGGATPARTSGKYRYASKNKRHERSLLIHELKTAGTLLSPQGQ